MVTSPKPAAAVDIEALKRVAEAATPGPWHYTGTETDTISPLDEGAPYICADVQDDDDASFIAAANPAVVLALVAALEQTRPPGPENARLIGGLAAARAVGEQDFCRVVYLGNRVSPLDMTERDELNALLAKAYKMMGYEKANSR